MASSTVLPMRPVYVSHPSSLAHDPGPHPEQPARIVAIEHELERRGWLGFERVRSPPASREVLERVHPASHVDFIERLSASGGGMIDGDTAVSSGSFDAAVHAAGGAVKLVELLIAGEAPSGFSAHRPPGHHATSRRAMGFCLFNTVAVAARHALDGLGLERVLILDWDVHHGNGTNDIFYATDRVLFASIHQWPLYPGSGAASATGTGAGEGFTINMPVPAGSGDEVFCSRVTEVVIPRAREYGPQLILVSTGYDAHRDDPLASCEVTEAGYAAMTAAVMGLGAELEVPVGFVLEGGYSLTALASSVAVTMSVMSGVE
jgi:acetoin utilization deacetylase AcuC-like enzyme